MRTYKQRNIQVGLLYMSTYTMLIASIYRTSMLGTYTADMYTKSSNKLLQNFDLYSHKKNTPTIRMTMKWGGGSSRH